MRKILFSLLALSFLSGCEIAEFAKVSRIDAEVPQEAAPQWSTEVEVFAEMSLYFRFASPSNGYGDAGPAHTPVSVPLAANLAAIRVQADDSIWGWSGNPGSYESDAAGDYTEVTRTPYHGAVSSSEALAVGALVGMWSDGTPNNANGFLRPFYIGPDAELDVPAGATELVLGMHDGYQWSNNWGSRQVTVSAVEFIEAPMP